MPRCFVCQENKGQSKMHPNRVAGKNICEKCYQTSGIEVPDRIPYKSPEDVVRDLTVADMRGKADPHRSGTGRFHRHKG